MFMEYSPKVVVNYQHMNLLAIAMAIVTGVGCEERYFII